MANGERRRSSATEGDWEFKVRDSKFEEGDLDGPRIGKHAAERSAWPGLAGLGTFRVATLERDCGEASEGAVGRGQGDSD